MFSVLAMRQDLSRSEREEFHVSLDTKLLPSFKKILLLSFFVLVCFFRAGQSLTQCFIGMCCTKRPGGSKNSTQAVKIVPINSCEVKQGDSSQIISTIISAELTQVR